MNIYEKMLENRIVILNDVVNKESANNVMLSLLYLDSLNSDDIYLYINSPGGDVSQGMAIIDCMNYIKSNVITVCIGIAYSMGAIILASGSIGNRLALPNSEIMIHEPSTEIGGKATDIMYSSERIKKSREKLAKIISKGSKKSLNTVIKDMKKDYFMSSIEAKEYGIIDEIIISKSN